MVAQEDISMNPSPWSSFFGKSHVVRPPLAVVNVPESVAIPANSWSKMFSVLGVATSVGPLAASETGINSLSGMATVGSGGQAGVVGPNHVSVGLNNGAVSALRVVTAPTVAPFPGVACGLAVTPACESGSELRSKQVVIGPNYGTIVTQPAASAPLVAPVVVAHHVVVPPAVANGPLLAVVPKVVIAAQPSSLVSPGFNGRPQAKEAKHNTDKELERVMSLCCVKKDSIPTVGSTALKQALIKKTARAADIIGALPDYAISGIFGSSPQEIRSTLSPDLVTARLAQHITKWGFSSIDGAWYVLKRMHKFFPLKEKSSFSLSGVEATTFLDHVEEESKKKVAKAEEKNKVSSGVFVRDGSSSLYTTIEHMKFLSKNFKLKLGADAPVVSSRKTKLRSAIPSASISLRMVLDMESYAADPCTPPIAAAQTGGWLALAYSCSRSAQIQCSKIGPEFTYGPMADFREGLSELEKHPNHQKQAPQNWYICMNGVLDRGWSKEWLKTLPMVDEGTFLICDTDSATGSPLTAAAWTANVPLLGERANESVRAILRAATGMSEIESKKFGTSSFRHFLPNVALATCDESTGIPFSTPELRNETGKWAGSVAKSIPPMDPVTAHAMVPIRKRAAKMPDRYAAGAASAIHVRNARWQIEMCTKVAKKVGHKSLPLFGGWHLFAMKDASRLPANKRARRDR